MLLLYLCALIFFILPVLKCSVSCGTGIQVRKIDCILRPAIVNDSNSDYMHNNNDNSHISILSDASSNESIDSTILSNERISMDCDPTLKPITIQPCTTGIECATVINEDIDSDYNENNSNNSNEDVDKTTKHSDDIDDDDDKSKNENENKNEDSSDNVEEIETGIDQNVYETSVEKSNESTDRDNGNNGSMENGDGLEEIDKVNENEVFLGGNSMFIIARCFPISL